MAAGCAVTFVIIPAIFLVVNLPGLSGERVLGDENEDFDFDGMPGVQYEFKVDIGAGAEDCFFQKAAKGADVHVSFEVLRGGDRTVNVFMRNSQGQVINAQHWKNQGVIEFKSPYDDTYVLCVDNTHGRFTAKLVYLYLVIFVMDDWSAYMKQIEDIYFISENVTQSLASVEQSIQSMRKSQSMMRFHVARDAYLVWANHRYVQHWSIAQCVVIVAASVIQVAFVRRLFRVPNVTPTAKPRA